MIPQYWSWLLTIIGVTGLYFAGSHRLLGWQIGLGVQTLWIAYAIATKQWGFIASAFAYGGVNLRNLLKWKRERQGKTMSLWDRAKKAAANAKQEIEEKVGDKLMEEEVNPTLRQHHGEPIKNPKDKS